MANDNTLQITIKAQADSAIKQVKTLNDNISKLGITVEGAKTGFTALNVAAGTFAANAAMKAIENVTAFVKSFARESIKAASEIEQLKVQFETLTGSASKAAQLVQDIEDLADNSPFDGLQLKNASRDLILFGVQAEDVKSNLKLLGDVAVASGNNLDLVTAAFGRVIDQGKLTSAEFRILAKNGIPIAEALAATLGTTEGAAKKLAQQGKITAEEFTSAFQTMNKEGGFAYDAIEKRNKTLEGRLKRVNDMFENVQEEVGKGLTPALSALATATADFLEEFSKSDSLKEFVRTIAESVPAALSFVSSVIASSIKVIGFFAEAWAFVNVTVNGFVAKYIDAMLMVAKVGQYIPGPLMIASRAILSQKESLEQIRDTAIDTATKYAAFGDKAAAASEKLSSFVENGTAKIIESYNKELAKQNEVSVAKDVEVDKEKSRIAELSEADLAFLDQKEKNLKAIRELETAERLLNDTEWKVFQDTRLITLAEYFTLEQAAQLQAKLNLATSEAEYEAIFTDIQKQGLEKRSAQQEKDRVDQLAKEKAKSKALQDLAKTEIQLRVGILQDFANLSTAILGSQSKQAFFIQKAAAAANIIVQGQIAEAGLTASLSVLGPAAPAAIASAIALQKVRTGIQLATVAAQTIQGFESGGVVGGNSYTGDNVMARVNSGEMVLNRQQQTNLFDQINRGNSGGETVVHTSVVLDGEVVAKAVSRQVANGFQLGEVQ